MEGKVVQAWERWKRPAFFLLLVLLMVWRSPFHLIQPQFYAEEGMWYFYYAYIHGVWDNLFSVHLGYFALLTNVATTASVHLVPLDYAPHVTTLIAWGVQLVPFMLVLWGTSPCFDTFLKKAVLCLLILTLSSGFLWMRIICSQYHLCVVVLLILVQDARVTGFLHRWGSRILIFIAGFTGVTACLLTPLFLMKHIYQKERECLVRFFVLLAASSVHLAVLIHGIVQGGLSRRMICPDVMNALKNYVYYNLISPLLNNHLAWKYIAYFFEKDFLSIPALCFTVLFVLYGFYLVWLLLRSLRSLENRMLVIAFFLISIPSTLFSLYMAGGFRYAYAPGVVLLVLILSQVKRPLRPFRFYNVLSLFFMVASLVVGCVFYRSKMIGFPEPHWPLWEKELASWKEDPSHIIRIPPKGWWIRLPRVGEEDLRRFASMDMEEHGEQDIAPQNISALKRMAEQGSAKAQFNLGCRYHSGEGLSQDYGRSMHWFRRAADQGDAKAQNNVGFLFENGQGVSRSYEMALAWYRKAAEQGYAVAQLNVGLLHELGRGVSQSDTEAMAWYDKASERGNGMASFALSQMSYLVPVKKTQKPS